jgi:hypothetical protein
MKACPGASDSGSVTLNFFEGDDSTAALGNRIMPSSPEPKAAAAAQSAERPRKSRLVIGSGSSRERTVVD